MDMRIILTIYLLLQIEYKKNCEKVLSLGEITTFHANRRGALFPLSPKSAVITEGFADKYQQFFPLEAK